jgi:DNA-binding beta-propeller fold protein YncE
MFTATLSAMPAAAQTLGVVMDFNTNKAVVFNADTDTVIGSVPIGGPGLGCSISKDQKLAYVTNNSSQLLVVDLTSPSLSAAPAPISISNFGENFSTSPDGKFAVVCGGDAVQPVSVVDLAARAEIGTFDLGLSVCDSAKICQDGSVLVTNDTQVRRLILSETGVLTDTGDSLSVTNPNNAFCSPNAKTGVAVDRTGVLTSFTIPGLAPVDSRSLGTIILSGLVNPAGDQVFVSGFGGMDSFGYNSTTGAMGSFLLAFNIIPAPLEFFGVDQMAIHPDGTKLYVSHAGSLNVHDTSTGVLLKAITDPAISEPTGICLSAGCPRPVISNASASPSSLWPPNHKMVDVTIDYSDSSSCLATCTISVTSNEPTGGTPDWVVLDAHHVQLRAERFGQGQGRTYTITITCTNSSGQPSSETVTVVVPHDQG